MQLVPRLTSTARRQAQLQWPTLFQHLVSFQVLLPVKDTSSRRPLRTHVEVCGDDATVTPDQRAAEDSVYSRATFPVQEQRWLGLLPLLDLRATDRKRRFWNKNTRHLRHLDTICDTKQEVCDVKWFLSICLVKDDVKEGTCTSLFLYANTDWQSPSLPSAYTSEKEDNLVSL